MARLVGRRSSGDPEAALVREVEASGAFDGGWYLRTHPKAARSGLSPALHLVRHGNAKRLDPGPSFSTAAYLERHPEAADDGVPALLHAIRHDRLGRDDDDDADRVPGQRPAPVTDMLDLAEFTSRWRAFVRGGSPRSHDERDPPRRGRDGARPPRSRPRARRGA